MHRLRNGAGNHDAMESAPQSPLSPGRFPLRWETSRGVVLAAVGGYLDALGFMMLDGCSSTT